MLEQLPGGGKQVRLSCASSPDVPAIRARLS